MKKILLISTILPCTNYSGGIYVEQVVNYLLDDNYDISFVCLKDPEIKEETNKKILNRLKLYTYDKNTDNETLTKEISNIVEKDKCYNLFLLMVREQTLKLMKSIYEKCAKPYYILSDDPMEWSLKLLNTRFISRYRILKLRKEVFKNAECIYCASRPMKKYYNKKFKTRTTHLYTSFKMESILPAKQNKSTTIKIGFSGQPYAKDAFENFIKVLDDMDWKFNNKNIVLNYFGNSDLSFVMNDKNKDKFNITKWLKQKDLINELNKCDFVYCPYYFYKDRAFKLVSKYSFPSKIVTYLLSGSKIIVHAPKYSSIYKFFINNEETYLIGDCKHKLKENIEKIFESGQKNKANEKSNQYYKENFLYENVREHFLRSLSNK